MRTEKEKIINSIMNNTDRYQQSEMLYSFLEEKDLKWLKEYNGDD